MTTSRSLVVRPPTIGLVGSIGAGKSTVAGMLAELGCVVCDSDALARESFEDPRIRQALRDRWGGRILAQDGTIDRRAIAAIVFADPAERAFLESLTHPWIESRRKALFAAAPPGTRALVIDAPLLLEAGLGPRCEAILFVDAPRPTRLERVQRRRGWDAAELARREQAQWPLERKRAAATHVLVNDGSMARLRTSVGRVLEELAPLGGEPPAPSRSGHET